MAVLAVDTATGVLAAAVGRDGVALVSAASAVPRGHSRLLQPMVCQLLDGAGLQPRALTGVVVGVGPGSYTGVRLGVTAAKTLGLTLGIPVFGASTLAAVAEAALPAKAASPMTVVPLLYARRQRAFGAVYERSAGHLVCLQPPRVDPYEAWEAVLARSSRPVWLVTDGVDVPEVADWLAKAAPLAAGWSPLGDVASGMGPALLRIAARQDVGCVPQYGEDLHALAPDYALRVEAEVKQEERSAADGSDPRV
ncbi:MAG: tRNA (adenosine(37)-N6)-threonylcarbamoyltransferase complex dimerization subunit type 1 TsaB [Alicyclobacillus sp.]|nr:tRNA (adenosine(37)-N6)-threonylcarbamoyltransferase complex dimerization subunit type 1 TsaB [Alicyclobacillus sp.]